MSRPPRKPDAAILDPSAIIHVSWMGIFICYFSLLLASAWYRHGVCHPYEWQTVLFSAIGFAQIGQAWGLRAITDRPFRFVRNPSLVVLTVATLTLQLSVMYIPPLAHIFKLQALPLSGLAASAGLGLFTFLVVHLERRLHLAPQAEIQRQT